LEEYTLSVGKMIKGIMARLYFKRILLIIELVISSMGLG